MIRITQSYLIFKAVEHLKKQGWDVVYFDTPGGRRSGIGQIALINSIWEKVYNLSPDILAINNDRALLIEVDNVLNDIYIDKFLKYKEKSEELKAKLSVVLKTEIVEVSFGFVSKGNKFPLLVDSRLDNFTFMYFEADNGKILEANFNS